MKLIIAGSRTFDDRVLMNMSIIKYLEEIDTTPDVVISGGARGADLMGETWAHGNNIDVERYLPDWDGLGKSAGYRRNELMASKATHLIAFHDGESRGTQHMIDIATRRLLGVKVVTYNEGA